MYLEKLLKVPENSLTEFLKKFMKKFFDGYLKDSLNVFQFKLLEEFEQKFMEESPEDF